MGVTSANYERLECKRFCEDMIEEGLEPYHYHGRFFWEGPAVTVADLQDALSITKVPCQWDQLGLGYVVYPRQKETLKLE